MASFYRYLWFLKRTKLILCFRTIVTFSPYIPHTWYFLRNTQCVYCKCHILKYLHMGTQSWLLSSWFTYPSWNIVVIEREHLIVQGLLEYNLASAIIHFKSLVVVSIRCLKITYKATCEIAFNTTHKTVCTIYSAFSNIEFKV